MNEFSATMLIIGFVILAICGLIYIANLYGVFIMFIVLGAMFAIVGFGAYAISCFKKRN